VEWIGLDEPPSTSLFRHFGASESPSAPSSPTSSTEWPVEINADLLASLPGALVLNLPDRSAVTLTRNRSQIRGAGAYLWSGSDRSSGCSGIFNAIPEHFLGTISCLNGSYRLRTAPTGMRLTRDAYADAPPGADNDVAISIADPPNETLAVPALPTPPSALTFDDRIDVLILFTASVRQAVENANGNAQQAMQLLVDETQQAMINCASAQTGFPLTDVVLVHAQEIARNETGTLLSDLLYLRNESEPKALRNYWGADIVMLVRESPSQGICGLAYTPGYQAPLPAGFAELAVGVAVRNCTFAKYNFQHEFAHILGANHNSENNPNPIETRLEPWALAHWDNPPNAKKDGHRTIVSYKVNIPPPNPIVCRGECIQVLNYANAEVDYVDDVTFHTGVAGERENARVIAEVAPFAWQWRSSLDRIFANGFD
jgi:hypothetical protein